MARDEESRSGRRSIWLVGLGVVAAAVVSVASVAFACSPQCCFIDLSTEAGPPGTKVTVTGREFGDIASELRWGSTDGPVLATTSGQDDWPVKIVIPNAATGYFFIHSVPTTGFDLRPAKRAKTFKVTSLATTPTGEENAPPSPSPASQSAPSATSAASSAAAPAATTAGAPAEQAAQLAPIESPASSPQAASAAKAPATAGAPAVGRARTTSANGTQPPSAPAGAVQSAAPAASDGAPAIAAATTPAGNDEVPQPWSDRPSFESSPGLDSGGRGDSPLGIGLALLGIGSVGLFGGIMVLAARRSRVNVR